MFEAIIGPLKEWALNVVHTLGYQGVFLLMLLDSLNLPIPSEVIMPTAGILAAQGKLSFVGVGFAGGFGTILGSMINYWLGFKLGKAGLIKYGRFLFIREKEVNQGEQWFEKHGPIVTLWGRFIPLVRTFISLPAGIYRMNFPLFVLYATIGAIPWCFAWAWVGFQLEENMDEIEKYWKYVDIIVVVAILYFLGRWIRSRIKEKHEASAT